MKTPLLTVTRMHVSGDLTAFIATMSGIDDVCTFQVYKRFDNGRVHIETETYPADYLAALELFENWKKETDK